MGEGMAAWSLIFDPSAGVPVTAHRAADAVWVREDGLKIAVETTATVTATTKLKIQQAADFLAADKSKSTVVLFVNAAHPEVGTSPTEVSRQLRMAVAKSAYSSRANIQANVAQRMALARWIDWFPTPGMVHPSFMSLSAQCPTGPGPGEGRFEPVDLLDPYVIACPDVNTQAMFSNIKLLYGVPHWQRRNPDPSLLDSRLLDHFGVPKELRQTPQQAQRLLEQAMKLPIVRRRMGIGIGMPNKTRSDDAG
ncbi:MAG: hypothetical protein ACYDEP_02585 [Acidimicrobiales bacterium]